MQIKTTGNKTEKLKQLIFSVIDILIEVRIPINELSNRRLERMAMAFLAVADIKNSFNEVKSAHEGRFLKTREIIDYENQFYSEKISSGSYDDIRRKDLVLWVEAGLIINSATLNAKATNNPTRGYALSPLFAQLVRKYKTSEWKPSLIEFQSKNISLSEQLSKKRKLEQIPVILPSGIELKLSAGEHNVLQKQIVEVFLLNFGFGAQLLYLGDTKNKLLYKDDTTLEQLNFFTLKHDELPDVIAYSESKNLLYLIEAVHSTGPMDDIRVNKLKKQLEGCSTKIVFITAFLSKEAFRKWVVKIAWETEVWIADNPDHLIHFNGYKFLEIHK